MSEALPDNAAEIERIFLWQDIVSIMRANALTVGIQLSFESLEDSTEQPTRMVLAERSTGDRRTVQLWAEASAEAFIGKAAIIFKSSTGHETFCYELTPGGIEQHSLIPTALDRDDLRDLRADVSEAVWDERESRDCAESLVFFS